MSGRAGRISRRLLRPVAALCLLFAIAWAWNHAGGTPSVATAPEVRERPRIDSGQLVIPAETAASMQLSAVPVTAPTEPRQLRLTGQLMLDPNRLVHVTSRFGGEVVSIDSGDASTPLHVGHHVEQDQLLAVIWSREIGEKKSDLVDALSQLYLHRSIYKRLSELASVAIPERAVEEMRHNYEADVIQVERVRRTLASWRLPEAELDAVEQEAQRIHADALAGPDSTAAAAPPRTPNPNWANTEVRAPITGVLLERNLTVGDIVDANTDLFKVADLSQLVVMASVYEEDLPALLSIPPEQRTWRIELNSRWDTEPLEGTIDQIGNVVDPNQHTAVVQGTIDNSSGRLRVGQFIEAVIDLPAATEELQVPLAALIDDGAQPQVLVAMSDDSTRWRVQPVVVHRRTSEIAWVEPDKGLALNDRVLVAGGPELLDVWKELSPAATPAASSANTATNPGTK